MDAGGEANQIISVLISSEESQLQQLGFRLWPLSTVTEGFTTCRSMKTAFSERAGKWWRSDTSTGGRWEPSSRPADPRRALAYEDEDIEIDIFSKISEKQRQKRKSSLLAKKIQPGGHAIQVYLGG